MTSLTETAIRAAKPKERPYKLADGSGLTLLVNPDGSKWWRLRYRIAGREKMLSLGVYSDVSLKAARERRDEARKALAAGVDPSARRKAESATQTSDTFEAIAREFLETKRKTLSASTWQRDCDQLEQMVFPYLGSKPIAAIEAPDLLAALRRIEARGAHDTAHRARALSGRIFRFGIATGRAKRDVAADLKGALAPKATKSYAAITVPAKVGELLRAIDGYDGQPTTAAALRLAPYVFLRPGELRAAEWSEFDLDEVDQYGRGHQWRIPPERMKMGEQHIVPLSTQAVAILRELQPLTGKGKFAFPAIGNGARPLSENTLNAALRRLGYTGEQMTAHGFRSMASTLLNEQGVHPDLIELQLAHTERNKVRAAYNRAQRLAERRAMMQAWADYLDGLRVAKAIG
jgi:integrase